MTFRGSPKFLAALMVYLPKLQFVSDGSGPGTTWAELVFDFESYTGCVVPAPNDKGLDAKRNVTIQAKSRAMSHAVFALMNHGKWAQGGEARLARIPQARCRSLLTMGLPFLAGFTPAVRLLHPDEVDRLLRGWAGKWLKEK